jgi:hypothetical protein
MGIVLCLFVTTCCGINMAEWQRLLHLRQVFLNDLHHLNCCCYLARIDYYVSCRCSLRWFSSAIIVVLVNKDRRVASRNPSIAYRTKIASGELLLLR